MVDTHLQKSLGVVCDLIIVKHDLLTSASLEKNRFDLEVVCDNTCLDMLVIVCELSGSFI